MELKQFIEAIGPTRTSKIFKVTRPTVYLWLHYKQSPRPFIAYQMIAYSNGLLSWEGIYKPFVEIAFKGRKVESIDPLSGTKITFKTPKRK